jgi:P2 family phage major capsid protein
VKQETRKVFNQYRVDMANLNGSDDPADQFTVTPTIQQKLETRIQESSAYLKNVNNYPVDEIKGEKIGMSTGSIASRTDTNVQERTPIDPTSLDNKFYECAKTDFDTFVRYQTLDMWAKFPDFQLRMQALRVEQQGRDRLMIGWNGTSRAATSDRVANPLLQDVNIGWLKKLQTEAAARYMTQGAVAGSIKVGPGGDYENMDALVYDMRSNLLAPWFARDNTFLAHCSADMLDEKYFPLVAAHGGTPSESNELDKMLSAKKLGGLGVIEVPFFPARTIFITKVGKSGGSNLSVYWQSGSRRMTIKDNPERDRVVTFESVNEDYVIEDLSAACAAINIKLPDGAGGWA